jgi:hypothetical protein
MSGAIALVKRGGRADDRPARRRRLLRAMRSAPTRFSPRVRVDDYQLEPPELSSQRDERLGSWASFTAQPNGARIKFDRMNLVPLTLDIGSSETTHTSGLGGGDTIAVGEVGSYSVTASGAPRDDTLTGGDSSESFPDGSGNDTINPAAASTLSPVTRAMTRLMSATTPPTSRSAAPATTRSSPTAPSLDVLDGFETVDRTQIITPAPVDTSTLLVRIIGGPVKVTNGTAPSR